MTPTPDEDEESAMAAVRYYNGKPMYYGRNGEALSLRQWSLAYSDIEAKTLARDVIGNCQVITVWNGVDSDPISGGPPLIFGSIVKVGDEWGQEIETSTEAEALAAHQQLVAYAIERKAMMDEMYAQRYLEIQQVLDQAHGTHAEDGLGEGIVEDVRLLMVQRDAARAMLGLIREAFDAPELTTDLARLSAIWVLLESRRPLDQVAIARGQAAWEALGQARDSDVITDEQECGWDAGTLAAEPAPPDQR